jgi:hypothetical protein
MIFEITLLKEIKLEKGKEKEPPIGIEPMTY